MRDCQAEYDLLGIEAIPGGAAGAYRNADERAAADPGYRQPENVLRLEGLVAIAVRWIAGTSKSR